jgi:proline dehydrogenase
VIRAVLLWVSDNHFIATRLPKYRFVRRAVSRFMPGEELEDALAEAARLRERRLRAIVTLLGENISQPGEAALVVREYQTALERIAEEGLDTDISVKLTQLGLDLDRELCRSNLEAIILSAAAQGRMVWVDIESSGYVDTTLELYRAMREKHGNVGLCLQSYLFRTEEDLEALLPLEPAIRLVKGAYMEPAEIAYPKKRDVDDRYLRLAKRLLDAQLTSGTRAVFATHDERLVQQIKRAAADREMTRGEVEFHMLYGINTELQESLAAEGHSVGALISYGSAWFPWYMRRLAERPANLWFVVRKMFS